ncbi:MAG: hypothetical protein EXR72_16175 [Myxococcales bacterium]|nr:hypothetical protein [Myxococcales bacterium]
MFLVPSLALLLAHLPSGAAFAQNDDPGMEAAPPPRQAPPRQTPPPTPTSVMPPATPQELPPMQQANRETPVKEEVKEEVSTSPTASWTDDEWEARLAAPSLLGGVGLFRMHTAEVGAPLNFRVGLHIQAFTADSFLVAGSGAVQGDTNSRFLGDLTIGLTGPDVVFLRNLEAYLAVFNSSNQNKRVDIGRTDPTVILSLGDVGFGLRGAGEVTRGLSLGGHVGVRFFNSISAVAANFDATNVSIDLLGMFDVRRVAPSVPLRFHLNLGYLVDNSLSLLPAGQCARSVGNDPCIRSRVVETFAYGLGTSRIRFALGLELPTRPHVSWGIFGVAPFVEYHLDHAVGDGDKTVDMALSADGRVAGDRIHNQNIQYLTVGLRLRPVARLVIDLGADIGLQSPGFQFGPPVPAWNVIAGLAYTYDPSGSSTKVIKKTITRTYEIDRAPPDGKLRGIVRDAKTKKPLSGAIVKYPGRTPQATGDDGTFLSYGLPAGPITLEISRGEEYVPTTAATTVELNTEIPIEVALTARIRESRVRLRVTDEKGQSVVGGTARFAGVVSKDGNPEGDGFVAQLPAGDYSVSIDAPGFLAKEKQISVSAGQDQTVDLKVRRRPAASHVSITKDAIVIKGVIHFGTNNATILPDGQQLLDEVADVLAKNRQLRRVSVEGHTDNRGPADRNLKLSKDRTAAAVEYLVKQGIGSDRLTSDGFGAGKPLVPNLTPANRARNRRVEFRIVEQGQAFPQ